ncbi:MAG: hypothetical protein HGA38_00060 [Candidatus Moranbacteria bacterium]|nr:hypothetical protein [Candidatus Moranbacteria bacterium]
MATYIQDTVGQSDPDEESSGFVSDTEGPAVSMAAVHTGETGEMSPTSLMLLGMFGAMDDTLDFASGWFPGIASLVSVIPTTGQVIVIVFDPNLRRQAAGNATKLIAKRAAVVGVIWLVEGVPVVNLLPLQTCAALVLKYMKSKQNQLARESIVPRSR